MIPSTSTITILMACNTPRMINIKIEMYVYEFLINILTNNLYNLTNNLYNLTNNDYIYIHTDNN